MYRLSNVLTPYHQHIEAGRFEVKNRHHQRVKLRIQPGQVHGEKACAGSEVYGLSIVPGGMLREGAVNT